MRYGEYSPKADVTARFYAPELRRDSTLVTLPLDEATHLTRVLRLKAGDRVRVFDGRGLECRAEIVRAARQQVELRVLEPLAAAPEPDVRLTLAVALLRGDRMDDVVRDATMMGVAAIRPLLTAHAGAPPPHGRGARARQRWERIALSSAKQCGRAVLPHIAPPVPWREFLATDDSTTRLMLVEPRAQSGDIGAIADLAAPPRPSSASLAIGPEGGWHPDEIEEGRRAGLVLIGLGRRTLRADAVPTAVLVLLQFVWGEL